MQMGLAKGYPHLRFFWHTLSFSGTHYIDLNDMKK